MDKVNKGRGGKGTSKEKIFIRTSFPSGVSLFLQLMTLVVVGGEGHFSMNRNQAGHHSCAEAHKDQIENYRNLSNIRQVLSSSAE